jgi:hypothetical protein
MNPTTLDEVFVTIKELSEKIAIRSENLVTETKVAFTATEIVSERRRALAEKRHSILLDNPDPKTLGSNESIREAAIADIAFREIEALREAEVSLRIAQHDLTLAQLDFDTTKLQIRLLEAASRFAGSGE